MEKRKRSVILFVLILATVLAGLVVFALQDAAGSSADTTGEPEEWRKDLYTPTMIEKIGSKYFIIDCWHHRIIYNDNLKDDIADWKTLTDEIIGGHSIAGDGELYLCDDTDRSMIRVFIAENGDFKEAQTVPGITGRPHFIKYDGISKVFYVISSTEGKIWTFENDNGSLVNTGSHTIEEITGSYVRSFNLIDGYMYLVSGPGCIYKIKYDDQSYRVLESYDVPEEMAGMNFLTKIGDYYYISSYTNAGGEIAPMFVRIKDLQGLKDREYEDLYSEFGFTGTPYYISAFDNRYFITEIDQSSGIKSFKVRNDNRICNIRTYYSFEGHSAASQQRKDSKY